MFFSKQMDKLHWYIQKIEYYSAIKGNELSSHEETWEEPEICVTKRKMPA